VTIRIGLVSEGPTDSQVISKLVERLKPDAEVQHLHPPQQPATETPSTDLGAGWRGVRKWCETYGGQNLELFLRGIEPRLDSLIVHVDASMADKAEIDEPCPPAKATTDKLRLVIVRDWLSLSSPPPYLVFATPSKEIEAWILAAFKPDQPKLECDPAISVVLTNELRRKHLLLDSTKEGRLRKSPLQYAPLATRLAGHLTQVRAACTEADRFAQDIEAL